MLNFVPKLVFQISNNKSYKIIYCLVVNIFVLESQEFAGQDNKINQYDERIKPYEQRVLNFLVNEYLMQHNYKLTSITFADENENQVSTLFF